MIRPTRALLAAWLPLCCAVAAPAPAAGEDEEEEEEDLQQRLTEREDERRPLEPLRALRWIVGGFLAVRYAF